MSLEDLSIEQLRQLAGKAQEYEAAHKLVNELGKDPEVRTYIQRHMKKKYPNVSMPEIEAEDRLMAALEVEKKEREKLAAKLAEDNARANIEKERARVKTKYGLTDEDMLGVEKLMVRTEENPEHIPFYDAAARVFVASRTPSTPTPASWSPPTYTMPESKTWGKGIGNPAVLNRIAMDEAYRAFGEVKGGKVAQ